MACKIYGNAFVWKKKSKFMMICGPWGQISVGLGLQPGLNGRYSSSWHSISELGTSLAIGLRDHTLLPSTRHMWTRPAWPQPCRLVLDLPIPEGWNLEGWVDLKINTPLDMQHRAVSLRQLSIAYVSSADDDDTMMMIAIVCLCVCGYRASGLVQYVVRVRRFCRRRTATLSTRLRLPGGHWRTPS